MWLPRDMAWLCPDLRDIVEPQVGQTPGVHSCGKRGADFAPPHALGTYAFVSMRVGAPRDPKHVVRVFFEVLLL